jgi:hypothetical protein
MELSPLTQTRKIPPEFECPRFSEVRKREQRDQSPATSSMT